MGTPFPSPCGRHLSIAPKHYASLAARMYRFAPNFLHSDELDMFHGIDEKISVETFAKVVQFFYRIIKNSAFDQ